VIGGLHRLGSQRATMTPEVAMTSARTAFVFFAATWAAAVCFGRSLWARNG